MRASAILIIITLVILVSAPAHATHKSWIICPKQAVMLILSLASTTGTDEQRGRIRETWCYDMTVPHEQVDGGQPDRPGMEDPLRRRGVDCVRSGEFSGDEQTVNRKSPASGHWRGSTHEKGVSHERQGVLANNRIFRGPPGR